jgi:hypothetical protein
VPIAVVQDLLLADRSSIEDDDVNRSVATPLVNSDKLRSLVLVAGNCLNNVQPVHISNVPRRVSEVVKVRPNRSSPQ